MNKRFSILHFDLRRASIKLGSFAAMAVYGIARLAARSGANRFFILLVLSVVFTVNQWIGEPALIRQLASGSLGGPLFAEEGDAVVDFSQQYDLISVSNQIPLGVALVEAPAYLSDTVGGFSNPSNEIARWVPEDAKIIEHTVADGDSVSSIAQKYGVSVDTIRWANKLTTDSVLKSGDTLRFPSVSGVLYKAQKGDSISGISAKYGVPIDWILAANDGIIAENLKEGDELILPGGKPVSSSASRPAYTPPLRLTEGNINTLGYFRAPTIGLNWGIRHYNNAVDIANACGTQVWAAASGVVIYTGWNGAYGNLIKISHPNGTITGYAHLSRIFVSVGAPVSQGDTIGLIGNTGRVKGVTGCHLHFEVEGGINPFIRYR